MTPLLRLVPASFALLTAAASCSSPALDEPGQRMLDPRREGTLDPRELVARLRLPPNSIVADIGAGPGFLTLPLARAVPQGRVLALDVRSDYLDVLRRRAADAGLANVETRTTPPESPQLEPRSIDLALLCQVD